MIKRPEDTTKNDVRTMCVSDESYNKKFTPISSKPSRDAIDCFGDLSRVLIRTLNKLQIPVDAYLSVDKEEHIEKKRQADKQVKKSDVGKQVNVSEKGRFKQVNESVIG
jgi:hypothetical protein